MKPSVLITGGTSEIGQAIAEQFLDRNWRIHLHFHKSQDKAEALRSQDEDSIELHQANLGVADDCTQLSQQVSKDENLTVLINNAALFGRSPRDESLDPDDWDAPMNVNAKAPWQLSLQLSSRIGDNEGSILNLTDAAVNRPYSDYLPYFASKGALKTLTHGLARALSPTVRVNAVAPGPIDFPEDYSEDQRENVINKTLLKRQGSHEEIARTCYFLAVEATYTTGNIMKVDGGRHLN